MFKKKSKADEKCEEVKDKALIFGIEIRANDFYQYVPVYVNKKSSLFDIKRMLAIGLHNIENNFLSSVEQSGTDRFLRQLEL